MISLACAQGSPEWLLARAGVCTASRFKDARDKYKRAYEGKKAGDPKESSNDYARMLAVERIAGINLDDTFNTWQMKRGQEQEPFARQCYESKTGEIAEESGIVFTDDKRYGYSTDGAILLKPGGIEIKVPSATDKIVNVWLDPDVVIKEYIDQIQGGMWITGWEWIDLVVYTPWLESVGKEIFIKRIMRDDEYIAALEDDLVEFWRRVEMFEYKLRGI